MSYFNGYNALQISMCVKTPKKDKGLQDEIFACKGAAKNEILTMEVVSSLQKLTCIKFNVYPLHLNVPPC